MTRIEDLEQQQLRLLKSELSSYPVSRQRLAVVQEQIQRLRETLRTGAYATRASNTVPAGKSSVRSGKSPQERAVMMLAELELEERRLRSKLEYLDMMISRLPESDRHLIRSKFIDGRSYSELGRLYNYSKQNQAKKVDRILLKLF